MKYILWLALSYLIGSVPFGLAVAKGLGRMDPREHGSGNVGATNVARVCGAGCGALTLALDMAKGVVPVAVAMAISTSPWYISLVALAAVLGHVFSAYLQFRGGKAVATTIGVFLPLALWQTLLAVVLLVAVVAASGYMSLGSLALVTALPALLLIFWRIEYLPLALVVMVIVYWRHKDNIVRLARGEETSWRKPAPAEPEPEPEADRTGNP